MIMLDRVSVVLVCAVHVHGNSEPHQARTIISSSSVQPNSSCYATSPIERVIFGSPLCRWNVIGIDFPPNFFKTNVDYFDSFMFDG